MDARIVELVHVDKSFGDAYALRDIEFSVPAGRQQQPELVGAGLGLGARGYRSLLQRLPKPGEGLRRFQENMASHPSEHVWLLIAAVLFAPLAEEYLFRGLLFRALSREWGRTRAIWGSALFFAIYHPPLSWLPVGFLGAASAWMFSRSGHLLPCVFMHMAYNAVVLSRL